MPVRLRALAGAISLALAEAYFWWCPSDNDPQFAALPAGVKAATILGLVVLFGGALVLFGVATWSRTPRPEQEERKDG